MKFTFITIVYNGENEIEKTIQSVINQKRPCVEYIIVDGKSNDNTIMVAQKYADFIDCIISEKDSGISDAFNKGIKRATGDFIGLINCGDTLLDGVVDSLIAQYETFAGYDVIYGDCQIDDISNNRIYIKKAFPIDFIWYGLPFSHQACLISKNAYNKYGLYDAKYRICMDYALIRYMFSEGAKFYYLPLQIAKFSTEGLSYRNPVFTMKEAMTIAILYGLPRYKAVPYAIRHIVRHYIKLFMEKIGLFGLISKLKDSKLHIEK